uniref:Protein FAM33A n=1 Tax=Babesia bovis TaxID=5865 RepID=S6BLZ8_BABBO|nr:hypothetical protein [Babesia bovis]
MVDGRWVQPQSVEEAIAFVSNKFADMGDDLALVEKKLIAEMSARYGMDVFDIHERCQEIRNRVTKLTNDLCELYKARERLVNVIESQLKQSSIIQNIEKLVDPNKVDSDTQLLENLGLHYVAMWHETDSDVGELNDVDHMDGQPSPEVIGSVDTLPKIEATTSEPEFKQVSQAQFDEIPALVKRRAKLEQINELYQFLFKKAVERNRCLPIKLKEISSSGIQVFGQTGSSKLASLRYLKIVELSNRDETVTLVDDRFPGSQNSAET